MKTRIFSTAIFFTISLVLLTGTSKAIVNENRLGSSLENAVDPALNIEVWMLNENFWDTGSHFNISRDYDNELTLETWMTDINRWESFNYGSTEQDEPLQMESWMTNSIIWDAIDSVVAEVNETELSIESWMTDPAYWYKPAGR